MSAVRALAYAVVLVLMALGTHAASQVFSAVRVAGGSMCPALMPGDLCVVRRTNDVEVGDIALIVSGRGMALHRVVGLEPDGFLRTKGDANSTPDAVLVPRGDVRGVAVRVVPVGALLERWRHARIMRYTLGSTE